METIKRDKVNKEIEELNILLKDFNRIGKKAKNILEKRGYIKEILGTGSSSKIFSKQVKELNIKSKKFLKGEYVAVGVYSEYRGENFYFRGYVKKIVD